jgi:hypothetical protein
VGVEADVRNSLATEGESHHMYSAVHSEGSSSFATFNAKDFISVQDVDHSSLYAQWSRLRH